MTNEDNACIRYLMKEMDPSEEVLMERAMMEDDDLLIEVECMRQTLKRLDKLPKVNPPAHITDTIIRTAAEFGQNNLISSRFISPLNLRRAAAALIIIGTTVGGFMFYEDYSIGDSSGDVSEQSVMQASSSETSPQEAVPQQAIQNVQLTSANENLPDPWIDRNDIIYFQDQYSEDNTVFRSILESSTEKLTPLDDPFSFSTGSRSLQLTGSGTSQ